MDRRQSFRDSVDESVQVRSIDSSSVVTVGWIDDVSDDGLRLTLKGYFPLGSVIEVESKDWKLCGTVIYECKSEKHSHTEYSCGIRTVHLAWNGPHTQ